MAIAADRVLRRRHQFARTEGIVPAPEPTHALAACIREALGARRPARRRSSSPRCAGTATSTSPPTTTYLAGEVIDYDYPEEKVSEAMARVPVVAGA